MPRTTDEIIAHADELAKRFEEYEPREGDEDRVSPLTLLRLAALKKAAAEREMIEGVRLAREQGVSWREIGAAVGTSGQAAHHRYGDMIKA